MAFRRITSGADFNSIVRLGQTSESKHLEFVNSYDWRGTHNDDPAIDLCADVAQFANAQGGVLLIGVTQVPRTRVAGIINAIDDVDEFRNWVERAIRSHLVPSNFAHEIVVLLTGVGPILAINIDASPSLIAVWCRETGTEYPYRAERGKEWMRMFRKNLGTI